jgi:hypothetical protein
MSSPLIHLHDELAQTHDRVAVKTHFGPVTGGRSRNGAVVFLGKGVCCPSGFAFDIIEVFRNTIRSPTSTIRESSSSSSRVLLPGQRIHHRELLSVPMASSMPILVDCDIDVDFGQTRYNPLTTAKLLVCMDRYKRLSRNP